MLYQATSWEKDVICHIYYIHSGIHSNLHQSPVTFNFHQYTHPLAGKPTATLSTESRLRPLRISVHIRVHNSAIVVVSSYFRSLVVMTHATSPRVSDERNVSAIHQAPCYSTHVRGNRKTSSNDSTQSIILRANSAQPNTFRSTKFDSSHNQSCTNLFKTDKLP